MRLNRLLLSCVLGLFTLATTPMFAQVTNDDCSDAIAIGCGETITTTTLGATADDIPECNLASTGPGIWYTVTGTGGDITVSTCSANTDFDTQLGIFEGNCAGLTCVAGNNQDFGCAFNVRQSTVVFPSEAGVTYYIYLTGQGGADGIAELSVSCEDGPIENDTCENATSISCGDVIIGSTDGASNDSSLPFCGTSLTSAPGVWYSFVGDGSLATVTTCGAATDYDTKMAVFDGSCGSLSCVGGDDDDFGCGFSTLQSVVEFTAEAGTTYYIYVTGFSTNSGTFELSLTCDNAPDNDDCSNAIAVNCGDVVSGSTEGASPASVSFCGTTLTTAGGVWYEVTGTGLPITVSTCNAGTNFDTKLGVFSGSCGDLSCVAGNDDDFGCSFSSVRSTVSFDSEAGESYYILVTGFSSNTGNFELSIECEEGAGVAFTCEDAIEIGCESSVTGSTTGAPTLESLGTCDGEDLSEAEGVWYRIEGNGLLVGIETIQEGTDYDPVLAVFDGSCDALNCVTANNNLSLVTRMARVEFLAEAGTTYYVYVTGQRGSDGDFELAVDCRVPNDDCDRALELACNSTVSGSTSDATSDSYPACGTSFSSAPGVWYAFQGSGTETTISTCNAGTDYDTKLFLFEGTCDNLVCVDGNDDDFGCSFSIRRSTITFDSEEGTIYYVLVTGFGSSNGNFELSLDCEIDDDNGGVCDDNDGVYDDVCDADCLTINEEYSFSNAGATAQAGEPNPGAGTGSSTCDSQDGWCSFELDVDNSVWFRFTAPASGCVNIDVLDADLQLAVWQASDCNDFSTFVEIGANDDGGPGTAPALVALDVTPGETYWVQVDGYNGALETAGTITVSDCDAPVPGCDDAFELLCGDAVTGSTVGEPTRSLSFCGTSLNTSGGVFFRFTGIGDNVTVSTCNAGTDFDTKLGVFSGSCGAPVCVAGNDDQAGATDPACDVIGNGFNRGSTVTFFANNGEEYLIYVTGFGANEGNFEVSVDCISVLEVDPNTLGNTITGTKMDDISVGNPYPNPTSDGISNMDIQMPVEGTSEIKVFDNLGRLVQQFTTEMYVGENRVQLDLNNLNTGNYYITVTIENEQFVRKLSVVR